MEIGIVLSGAAIVWVVQAAALSRIMSWRGFHPVPIDR